MKPRFRHPLSACIVLMATLGSLIARNGAVLGQGAMLAGTFRLGSSYAGPHFTPVNMRAAVRVEEFFELLNGHDVRGALQLLSSKAMPTLSARQAWTAHLGAIRSVRIVKLTSTNLEGQNDRHRTYKVLLDIDVLPSAANAQIPNYGWGDNPNVRWITVELEQDGVWRIVEIATGP